MPLATDLAVSPDGKRIALGLMGTEPKGLPGTPAYVPFRHSAIDLWGRFFGTILGHSRSYESKFLILIFSREGNVKELLLPDTVASIGPWSPDGRRLPFLPLTTLTSSTQIWIAEPDESAVRMACQTSGFAAVYEDAWTSSGDGLRMATAIWEGKTIRWHPILLHLASGTTEPLALDDLPASPTQRGKSGPLFWGDVAYARNGTLAARDEKTSQGSRVIIERKDTGEEVASFRLPGKPSQSLNWSPDSRRLAVVRDDRIWVYDLDAKRLIPIRLNGAHSFNPFRPAAWSADSRSLYATRSLAMGMLGIEVLKITLPEA